MKVLSIKKFNIFRKVPPPKGAKQTPPPGEKKRKFWKKITESPLIFILLFVLAISYFISYVPSKSLPVLEKGEIAAADVVAPSDITIVDRETTEERKKAAEESILPVYSLDKNVFLNIEEKVREFFNFGREWRRENSITARNIGEFQSQTLEKFNIELTTRDISTLARIKFSPEIEEILVSLLNRISARGIILSKKLFIHGENENGFTLVRGPENERTVRVEDILDLNESKAKLTEEIEKLDLSERNKTLLISLSHSFIQPNISYNKVLTDTRKSDASSRVEDVFYTIKKGKVIVRKGDEVTDEALKQINIINQNIKAKPGWLTNFIGTFFLFSLLFAALWYYLSSTLHRQQALKHLVMMGIIFILSLLFYKLSRFLGNLFSQNTSFFLLSHAESYWYVFPYQIGVLILAFLSSNHIALVYTVINSLLVGHMFKGSFSLIIFTLLGGLAGIYGVKYYTTQKRGNIFKAGFFIVAPVNIFVIIILHLIREKLGSLGLFTSEIIMGLVGALLSATFAFLFLPVFEYLFQFLTPSKLFELTNSDLPIFKQMAIEAPGSYHHSLVVSTLAEKAAKELALDSMLLKAGGLYHDIGKTIRPEYFIENQSRNPNLHKDLTPSMSSLVIINHVKEGVELAKKLKLPRIIRDFIQQHHGNSLVRYFYQKAKEKYDPEMQKIEEERYRYPGPRPQTKEAALLLLADAVEAASRSLKSPTKENIKRVINDIFENMLQDGQLDECDFSLKELKTAASSFLTTLYSIYHPRVDYPGFEFEPKKRKKNEKKQNSNDRNNKSPEKVQHKPGEN
ncbi:MAG: HD family phosphohydrolase [Candidatus Aminicenantales bacterium]